MVVHNHSEKPSAKPRAGHVQWLSFTAMALLLLGISRWLTPEATGHGTHTQLGLPPCGFLWLTGWPCPACGLTTSFAHLSRFQLVSALQAHALGPVLFALVAATVPVGVVGYARRIPVASLSGHPALRRMALALIWATGVTWFVRIVGLL
jgi:hypothetical protein